MLFLTACRDAITAISGGRTVEGSDRVAWRLPVISPPSGGRLAVDSTRVYVYTSALTMAAYSLRTRAELWSLGTNETNFDRPMGGLVLCGGRIVFGTYRAVYGATPATGERNWRSVPSLGGSLHVGAPVCAEGVVFFGTYVSQRLYAVDAASGRELWGIRLGSAPSANGLVFTPSVSDGVVVTCTRQFTEPRTGTVLAVDARSGQALWQYTWVPLAPIRDASCARPVVVSAGVVLAAVDDGRVFGLDLRTGQLRWTLPPVAGYLTPAEERGLTAGGGGVALVGSLSGVVQAVDTRTGTVLWTAGSRDDVTATNIIDPGAGDAEQMIGINQSGYALAFETRTGRRLWTVERGKEANERILFAPGVLTPDLFIAVGSDGIYGIRRR